ncbi:MAG TPA: glycoside hydrolase family 95 protein, partial [Candidatus Acidoferrales bacterium]|nr:glycoside hydrolase family 95 protein [Candidatus Acidoferrales bacterium]
MPRTRLFIFATLVFTIVQLAAAESSAPALWYQQPAQKWTDALPIGNGRLGAMVFGGIFDERIQFNEDTLWTGKPHDYVRVGAGDQLAEIRRLLAAGQTKEASALAKSNFLSDPVRQKAYQPFGDLHLHFPSPGEVT